ncbi:hypothetical protein [Pseudomonas putida]|uniref:hypothetical protein n=1 Tax=Pseudomonas putida TaxID=303 RepID=UPI000818FB09|nr:hypothetical protein [Pseudomonas putida]OCT21123.1 hypothetical protein A6E20_18045 [Pseudomonas putida]OCT26212.1 hypothetical protein A6E23_11525 [Pseudomonas putida]OCT30568.1 hypothetical protein A6E24_04305 [Pseudomonas putida]OCT37086.1 hypothetical protein A6E19_18900 [Pseudomonas putida]
MTSDILGPARHLIGTRYVESIKPYIAELTGLPKIVGPDDATTMDLRTDRILVSSDEHGVITDLIIR